MVGIGTPLYYLQDCGCSDVSLDSRESQLDRTRSRRGSLPPLHPSAQGQPLTPPSFRHALQQSTRGESLLCHPSSAPCQYPLMYPCESLFSLQWHPVWHCGNESASSTPRCLS